jgi:hypothetical protein
MKTLNQKTHGRQVPHPQGQGRFPSLRDAQCFPCFNLLHCEIDCGSRTSKSTWGHQGSINKVQDLLNILRSLKPGILMIGTVYQFQDDVVFSDGLS